MELRGRWMVDVDREGRAMVAFVWGLRPSYLRWPFLLAVALVAALLTGIILATGLIVGWILLGVLAALLLVVLVLRVVLVRSLTVALMPGVANGTSVEVTLDDSAWHSTSPGRSHVFPWADYDRVRVSDGYLVLTATWKGKWIPRSVLYAPLAAFDTDPDTVVGFVSAAIAPR